MLGNPRGSLMEVEWEESNENVSSLLLFGALQSVWRSGDFVPGWAGKKSLSKAVAQTARQLEI